MGEKPLSIQLFALALLLPALPAAAADVNLPGARLAASCFSCHGAAGVSATTALPPLAGQSKDALLTSLRAYKAGTRPATIMHQLAKGYTDEQLELIAGYYAAQKKSGTP